MTSRPANPPVPPDPEAPSFEDALQRLEAIVEELEHGALSLEDSIRRFEEGMGLSRRLTQLLEAAEQRIERLVEREPGKPTTEPFEPEDASAAPREPRARPNVAPRAPAPAEPGDRSRGGDPASRGTPRGGTEELPF